MSEKTSPEVTEQETTPIKPLCRHMRTKALFLDGPFDPNVHSSDPSGQYWCLHSMHSMGPDGEYVCPEDCHPKRGCFE